MRFAAVDMPRVFFVISQRRRDCAASSLINDRMKNSIFVKDKQVEFLFFCIRWRLTLGS